MNLREIIIGGLLLPFRLYFQPTNFRQHFVGLASELPYHYSLWQARHKLREPDFRRGLTPILLQAMVALLWAPALSGVFAALGYRVDWFDVASGVVGGLAFGVAFGVVNNVAFGVVIGVAFSVSFGLASGVASSVVSSVAVSVMVGMAVSMMVGSRFRVADRRAGSVASRIASGVAGGVMGGVLASVMGGVVIGVAVGLTSVLIYTRIPFFPSHLLISMISWFAVKFDEQLAPPFWRISPPRWDEKILPPLPGLPRLLVSLSRVNQELGVEAINEVAAHRYQYKAAAKAQLMLATDEARLVDTLPALENFGRSVEWLDDESPLPESTKSALRMMRNISKEAADARNADSITNRVRRLEAASKLLAALREKPGPFGSILERWQPIIERGLEEARKRQIEEEPIPQVYFKDGRPIRPDDLPESAVTFKGRQQTFRQLENALGGQQRSTLLLVGPRRTGKTSLLHQLPHRLGSQIVPVFLDLQASNLGSSESSAGLIGGMMEEIAGNARQNTTRFNLQRLRFPSIDRAEIKADPYPAFGRWIAKVEKSLGERTLLLCLDEFEKLDEGFNDGRFDKRILSTIRNLIQHHNRIAVLLAGSHHISELPPHWADTLVTTQMIPLSFLDEADARELILHPVPDFPEIYRTEAVDRVLQLTHSQPYLVQLMCGLLVEKMNRERRQPPESFVGADDVESVIPKVFEQGASYFDNLWRSQAGGDLAQRILERMAERADYRIGGGELRRITTDEDAMRDAVATLMRREIIKRDGEDFQIIVPLVAEYVRSVRPRI